MGASVLRYVLISFNQPAAHLIYFKKTLFAALFMNWKGKFICQININVEFDMIPIMIFCHLCYQLMIRYI